jgi:hypothetical protein
MPNPYLQDIDAEQDSSANPYLQDLDQEQQPEQPGYVENLREATRPFRQNIQKLAAGNEPGLERLARFGNTMMQAPGAAISTVSSIPSVKPVAEPVLNALGVPFQILSEGARGAYNLAKLAGEQFGVTPPEWLDRPQMQEMLGNVAGIAGTEFGARAVSKRLSPDLEKLETKGLPRRGTPEEVRAIGRTLLEEDLPKTEAGYQAAQQKVADLQAQYNEIVIPSAQKGTTIRLRQMNDALDDLRDQYKFRPEQKEIEGIIKDVRKEFNRRAYQYKGGKIPIDVANEIKAGAWQAAGERSFGKLSDNIKIEAYKRAGHGILEAMIDREPSLRVIGQREASLIKAQDALAQLVRTELTKNSSRYSGTLMAVGVAAGEVISGHVGGLAGGAAGVLLGRLADEMMKNPEFQHKAARTLDRLAPMARRAAQVGAGARRAGTASAISQQDLDEQAQQLPLFDPDKARQVGQYQVQYH